MPIPTDADYRGMIADRSREVDGLLDRLFRGRIDPAGWQDGFDAVLWEGHSRASALGRNRAGDDGPFGEIDEIMGREMADRESEWLDRFREDLEGERYRTEDGVWREGAVRARARLYLGKMRATAAEAFVETGEVDEEYEWILGGVEDHCEDCPRIAALSPFTRDTILGFPGSGDTECLGNCKCHLRRRRDGRTTFLADGVAAAADEPASVNP